jgi:hypothetical protein
VVFLTGALRTGFLAPPFLRAAISLFLPGHTPTRSVCRSAR